MDRNLMNPELRALFPVTERAIYLNHAAVSPPPISTIRAVESQLRDVNENGSINFRKWLAVKEHARELLANLLGARPQQVAIEALGGGLDNQSGGPVQGYVDGRLTILRGRTTLLSLRAEIDYDLELSVGRMGAAAAADGGPKTVWFWC